MWSRTTPIFQLKKNIDLRDTLRKEGGTPKP